MDSDREGKSVVRNLKKSEKLILIRSFNLYSGILPKQRWIGTFPGTVPESLSGKHSTRLGDSRKLRTIHEYEIKISNLLYSGFSNFHIVRKVLFLFVFLDFFRKKLFFNDRKTVDWILPELTIFQLRANGEKLFQVFLQHN